MTVSLPEEVVDYLRSKLNVTSVVAEAVEEYRVGELQKELEAAYREDAEESERFHEEWASVDAEVTE